MKRRELAHEELDKVIKLKQIGTSWLKIEHETGISRRTAKRAYEKWQRSQSPEVLREARKDVAAKAFLDHLKCLTTLAGSFVTNLSVPSSPDTMTNVEQFFAWLWQQNLLWRGVHTSPEELYNLSQVHAYTMGGPQYFLMGDPQFNVLENQLLFKALKEHTREEVCWEALDEWGKARDNCVKVLPKLWKETSEVVNNFLNQERQSDLLQRIKDESKGDDPIKRMAEAVFKAIWGGIVEDKLDQESPFKAVSRRDAKDIRVQVGAETLFAFTEKSLAEKVTHICNLAYNNLREGEKSHMVGSLQDGVRTMQKATEKLREKLNPVNLTPIILRTRCDLCPA